MTAIHVHDDLSSLSKENAKLRTQVRHQKRYHADRDEMARRREAELTKTRELLSDANRIMDEQFKAIVEAYTALTIAAVYVPNHPEITRVVELLRGRAG